MRLACPKCRWTLGIVHDGSFGLFCWNPLCPQIRVYPRDVPSSVENLDRAVERKRENKIL